MKEPVVIGFFLHTIDLPLLNAILNTVSAIFLFSGYLFIRRGHILQHKICMLSALFASILFLISYLTNYFISGVTHFTAHGWIKFAYFFILLSHMILAIILVPLVLVTIKLALQNKIDSHKKTARWTFPIWAYVSITGVIVYLMLYHL